MKKSILTLTEKNQLTHDVYELIFFTEEEYDIQPGQFMNFFVLGIWVRAYSVAFAEEKKLGFFIKEISSGTGGSQKICSLEIGEKMEMMGPIGHFVLRENFDPKLFIGTGTGFAPLFFQIQSQLKKDPKNTIHFLFWVREKKDIFYENILKDWQEKYPNFSYEIFISREEISGYKYGRVTSILEKNISQYKNFYMCGSPAMVQEMRLGLQEKWVEKEKIFFEQY